MVQKSIGVLKTVFRRHEVPFSMLLPLLSVANWTALVAVPSVLFLLRFGSDHSFEPRPIHVRGTTVFLPPLTPLSFALRGVASSSHGFIVMLNAPAILLSLPISIVFNHGYLDAGSLSVDSVESLTYPFLAIPAWLFVGRGLDAFAGRTRLKVWHLTLSLILVVMFSGVCLGLRFGTSAAEREGRMQLGITGLGLWAILFAIPAIAWFRAKYGKQANSSESGA